MLDPGFAAAVDLQEAVLRLKQYDQDAVFDLLAQVVDEEFGWELTRRDPGPDDVLAPLDICEPEDAWKLRMPPCPTCEQYPCGCEQDAPSDAPMASTWTPFTSDLLPRRPATVDDLLGEMMDRVLPGDRVCGVECEDM